MSKLEESIQQVKRLIGNAKLDLAIGYLLDLSGKESKYLQQIYAIKYRISDLKNELIEGTISDSGARVERNRLVRDLLNLVELIKEEQFLVARHEKADSTSIQSVDESFVFRGDSIVTIFKRKRLNVFKLDIPELVLNEGQITAVVGENGSGKTTLLKIIAGKISSSKPTTLTYSYGFKNSSLNLINWLYRKYFRWYGVKSGISYIPETFDSRASTVLDTLRFEATKIGITGASNHKEVEFFLQRLDLYDVRYSRCAELSRGFQLRLELAIALIKQPRLLILDEPLAHLDVRMRERFLLDLRNITKGLVPGVSTIISSHQVVEVEYVADRTLYLENGKVSYYGNSKLHSLDSTLRFFEFSASEAIHVASLSKNFQIKVLQLGLSYIAITSSKIDIYEFIKILKQSSVKIIYIRDISLSLKKVILSKDIDSKVDLV